MWRGCRGEGAVEGGGGWMKGYRNCISLAPAIVPHLVRKLATSRYFWLNNCGTLLCFLDSTRQKSRRIAHFEALGQLGQHDVIRIVFNMLNAISFIVLNKPHAMGWAPLNTSYGRGFKPWMEDIGARGGCMVCWPLFSICTINPTFQILRVWESGVGLQHPRLPADRSRGESHPQHIHQRRRHCQRFQTH